MFVRYVYPLRCLLFFVCFQFFHVAMGGERVVVFVVIGFLNFSFTLNNNNFFLYILNLFLTIYIFLSKIFAS